MESSDDENEPRLHSWPPLKLYEDLQAEAQAEDNYAKLKGYPVSGEWRRYRARRFYNSIMGFHKGNLDLSGRHQDRYTRLKASWDEYLLDFKEFLQTAPRTEEEFRVGDHPFSEPGPWTPFSKKWRLQRVFIVDVLEWTGRVLHCMLEFPEPKIQSLCIEHLPVELIQQVYQFSNQEQARLLSSTSRYMRTLAVAYIFGSRTVKYGPDPYWFRFSAAGIETPEDAFRRLQENATSSRDQYIETLNFVLSRPDLIRSLTSLALLNSWSASEFDDSLAEGFLPTESDPDFYTPIHHVHHQFFQAATNLTDLWISTLEITLDFVRVTANLPSLCTLEITHCSLAHELQAGTIRGDIPKYERVLNLHIIFDDRTEGDDRFDAWYLLPLCPNLQTLSVRGSYSGPGISLPPEEVRDALNPFKTLPRFSIRCLDSWEVSALGEWIQGASDTERHQIGMTHFKLHTKGQYSEMDIAVLASALSLAPGLDVCVFEGLRRARPELITLISRFIPDILALTIVASPVLWKSPMWAYSSRFSSFSRLQYFGWNVRFDPETSTAQMTFMEDGYPKQDMEGLRRMREAHEASHIWTFDRTAAAFAAYCPSLRFVGLHIREHLGMVCSIDRTERGLEVREHDIRSQAVEATIGEWSTVTTDEGWPRVYPKRS